MSGPKLSQAEIERQRQEALARERQRRIQVVMDIQSCQEEIRKAVHVLHQLQDQMLKSVSVSTEAARRQLDAALRDMPAVMTVNPEDDVDSLLSRAQKDAARARALVAQARTGADQILRRDARQKVQVMESEQARQATDLLASMSMDQEGVKQNVVFTSSDANHQLNTQLLFQLRHMRELTGSEDPVLQNLGQKGLSMLAPFQNSTHLTEDAGQIRAAVEQLVNAEQDRLRVLREAEGIYRQYTAMCALAGIAPQPRDAFSQEKLLQTEVRRMSAILQKQDEMDFIADQVNEAMLELGYSFVSSSVVRVKDSSGDMSLYAADSDTGISIYTDDHGQVTMWVTNLSDQTGDISDEDRDFSYQRQLDFCAGHPDIVTALRKRGVILQAKRYERPDRKYTHKVAVRQGSLDRAKKVNRGRRRRAANLRHMQVSGE
ncbi:MAG: hypothetical protein IJ083_05310 [Clostridia bacterium]|nr:hypothetical protein [Clostridia bacterium]